ncbi:MAG: hypothetical protein AB7D07_03245 [Desulfovibrionaceae bacterium]
MAKVTKETMVEDLVKLPGVVGYGVKSGVSLFACSGGHPMSLGRLLEIRKIADPDGFIDGLNAFLSENERK